MNSRLVKEPRIFGVGERTISYFGMVLLGPGEMISVAQDESRQCDVTATSFGFYLGSSDERMANNGFRIVLVENPTGKRFVMAVLDDRRQEFDTYLNEEQSRILCWLDEVPATI